VCVCVLTLILIVLIKIVSLRSYRIVEEVQSFAGNFFDISFLTKNKS